ncbi:Fc receptor-like B [Tupaia chinensis]|uniref:Fc receptor-like B n=1 Tax=Tupaia chinensis TaxID=246437 RepID=L9L8H3_TUPCH|nr:Fc receptor-like B [Tupaia chinensis]
MWSLTVLLLLVPSSGQAATLEKPTLSLHPPWTTIFKGERVTLRCDGYHPLLLELRPISTLWYLGHLLLPSHKKSIEVQTPGVYRCQTRGAPVSDPIHLSVSNDWLILQVPYAPVFEGEPLTLRCRGWYDKVVYKLHYYHDGQAVRYFHSSANYTVLQARASDSGRYQCSGTMRIPVESAPMFSAKVAVTVQEGTDSRCVTLTGSPQELASTSASAPQAAALAPGDQPLSFRKPPVSRSVPSVTSVPNTTSAGLQFRAGSGPTAGPPACAPRTPLEPSAGAPKPDVALLLREIQLLKGLLSRVVLGLKEPQAPPELRGTPETSTPHLAVSPGTPETTLVES